MTVLTADGQLPITVVHNVTRRVALVLKSECSPSLEVPFKYYPPFYVKVFQVVLSLSFPQQNSECISVHVVLLDLITLLTFGEQDKPCNSSLRGFLQFPFTPSLLDPNILLSTLLSNTLKPMSFP